MYFSVESKCNYLLLNTFLSIRVRIIRNLGENGIPFLTLKSKLGLHYVVHTNSKTSLEKLTLTVVEMQQLPEIEETDSEQNISYPKGQKMQVGEKYVQTSRLKKNNWILSFTITKATYNSKLKRWIWNGHNIRRFCGNDYNCWVCSTYFSNGALYWMRQLLIFKSNFVKNRCSLSNRNFPIALGD